MLTIQRTLIELCATSSLEGKVRVHVLVSCPLSFFDASESPANQHNAEDIHVKEV